MHALSTMYYIIFSASLFCTVILHNVVFFYIYSTSDPNWIRYINSPVCKLYNPPFLCIKCNNNPDT